MKNKNSVHRSSASRLYQVVILTLGLLALVGTLGAGEKHAPAPKPRPQQTVPGPRIWLQENQALPVRHVPVSVSDVLGRAMTSGDSSILAGLNQAQPVSLTSGDLDADGFEDLIVGYSAGGSGFISIHRGNMDAFAPQSSASFEAIRQGKFPSPFLLDAKTFPVPISPDFIAVGDFTGHGNRDLAVAAKGGNTIYIFAGDGKGNFTKPQMVALTGGVNSLGTGQLGANYLPTLIVGISGPGKRFALAVFAITPNG